MIEERGREWGNLSRQVLGVGRQQLRLSERKARGGTETETKTVTHSLGRLDDNTAAAACDRDDASGASANRRANHSCMHHFHPSRRVATAIQGVGRTTLDGDGALKIFLVGGGN